MRVLVLDNYDSFTYNLVQYLGELGAEVDTVRNDRATVDELLAASYERCVVSPGPCTPDEAGITLELVRRMPESGVPMLGVCLGHQALAQAFGGRVRPQLPDCLEESAFGGDVVMGIRHRELPAEGVQFHPESVLTAEGKTLLANFLGER